MRILVCGGRHYEDRRTIRDALVHAAEGADSPVTLVHGAAPGADQVAASVAHWFLGWATEAHPADWKRHGRAAGPIRNAEMAAAGADMCLAFPGGRGTADMVRRAEAAGIPVRRIGAGEVT